MTYSYTTSHSNSFTRTHAKRPASKVASDLKRMQRYYGKPSESMILQLEQELIEYLISGYLRSIEYGFKLSDGTRVVSLFYVADLSGNLSDDRAGGVPPRSDVTGTYWFSFLTHNYRWLYASSEQQERFKEKLPFQRDPGEAPKDGHGYWIEDRSYSHTGSGVRRKIYRPY